MAPLEYSTHRVKGIGYSETPLIGSYSFVLDFFLRLDIVHVLYTWLDITIS